MKRGDIFWAQLFPRSGAEQQGYRPVIIVSNNGFNRIASWGSLIVVPISTSAAQLRRHQTIVFLPAGSGGLPKDSAAVCHQVTTLDRAKFGPFIGSLNKHLLSQLDSALKAAMRLP